MLIYKFLYHIELPELYVRPVEFVTKNARFRTEPAQVALRRQS